MSLIFFRGLNCHLACIINIAALYGLNYADAFGELWSETDFEDNKVFDIYLSKKILPCLETIGAKALVLGCAAENETQKSYSSIENGEFFVIGTDTFYIPWNPVYQNFHEAHYFFAQKENRDYFLCYDPTYGAEKIRLKADNIITHAFDLSRVIITEVSPRRFNEDIQREACAVLRKHPETTEKIFTEILNCKNNNRINNEPVIKQIIAMINNRYLFKYYLNSHSINFKEDFLPRWEAVKNGLYKASIIKNNEKAVDEVLILFSDLIREEIETAKKWST